ncbi:MAG: peptidase dimerization domain-containing protein [archaeon]|nr:peptidase dimerization domain-containing protein [archaeon]
MAELILNKTWRPTLSYIGIGGLPQPENAGNVLRSETRLTISVRLPPNKDPEEATRQLKEILEADPPYHAEVEFTPGKAGAGFDAPALPQWLAETLSFSSQTFWGLPVAFQGEGGSIPFMGMLRNRFPEAAFAVTGVLGPSSNAHGPNEFMDIKMAKNICKTVALVIANAP